MTRLSCFFTRRALGRLHDGELWLESKIAVERHLARCPECSVRRRALSMIQRLVREGAGGEGPTDYDDEILAGLLSSVVRQVRVESRFGWRERIGRVMADASNVLIPGGAFATTLVVAGALAVVLTGLTPLRQDSLSAVLQALATPGSNANPVQVVQMMMRGGDAAEGGAR